MLFFIIPMLRDLYFNNRLELWFLRIFAGFWTFRFGFSGFLDLRIIKEQKKVEYQVEKVKSDVNNAADKVSDKVQDGADALFYHSDVARFIFQ